LKTADLNIMIKRILKKRICFGVVLVVVIVLFIFFQTDAINVNLLI